MAALNDLVEFQLENARKLSDILEKEKMAITRRSSEDIASTAQEKLTVINLLNQTDQRIAKHPDVNRLNEDNHLMLSIASIRSIIHDCQQANLVNGEALSRAQVSFNKLNNLMQQSHGKIGMTYNATGKTHTVSTLGTNLKA